MEAKKLRDEKWVEELRRSQKARGASQELVDYLVELDEQWRKLNKKVNDKRAEVNSFQKKKITPIRMQMGALKKEGKTESEEYAALAKQAADLQREREELQVDVAQSGQLEAELKGRLDALLGGIGNVVHPSVPVAADEDHNTAERTWLLPSLEALPDATTHPMHHSEVMWRIGAYETDPAIGVAGERSYFLTGPGVRLNLALQNYGIQFLAARGYQPISTPLFMRQSVMAKTAQLSDFDEQLYRVVDGKNEDSYLIATSEQPLSAYFQDGNVDLDHLPGDEEKQLRRIRWAGLSTCFRKEAGKGGQDLRGLFRVHQFEKVEQFCITRPEDSWEEMENMIKVSEEFYQSLGLSYQVVNIVSGALNDAAAKKYDLEAWFPNTQEYRELVSCSNCTDYQSVKLNVRYGYGAGAPFVHMLNSTLTATERTLCCIAENYQTPEGLKVPEPLQPFVGCDFFPFVREAKAVRVKDAKAAKHGGKKGKGKKQGGKK